MCGACGHHMSVHYDRGGRVCYTCFTSDTRRLCQHVNGRYIDSLIEQVILETLSREEFELSLCALDKIEARSEELENQWQQKIEAARYEVDKAARRYYRVEPENRLVARTLETQWNQKLEEVKHLEQRYQKLCETPPFTINQVQRDEIMALAKDLPRLWRAKTTKNGQRKQILRILIEDVTLTNKEEPWSVQVKIQWKTGVVSVHQANRVNRHPRNTSPEVISRIKELYMEHTDKETAQILNKGGFKSGYSRLFTTVAVLKIRHRNKLLKNETSKIRN